VTSFLDDEETLNLSFDCIDFLACQPPLAQNWRQSRQGRMQHYGNYTQTYNSYNYPYDNHNTIGAQPLHMHYNPLVDPNLYFQLHVFPDLNFDRFPDQYIIGK